MDREQLIDEVIAKPRANPNMEELSSMDREQLIDEVIKARAEAERAKKVHFKPEPIFQVAFFSSLPELRGPVYLYRTYLTKLVTQPGIEPGIQP